MGVAGPPRSVAQAGASGPRRRACLGPPASTQRFGLGVPPPNRRSERAGPPRVCSCPSPGIACPPHGMLGARRAGRERARGSRPAVEPGRPADRIPSKGTRDGRPLADRPDGTDDHRVISGPATHPRSIPIPRGRSQLGSRPGRSSARRLWPWRRSPYRGRSARTPVGRRDPRRVRVSLLFPRPGPRSHRSHTGPRSLVRAPGVVPGSIAKGTLERGRASRRSRTPEARGTGSASHFVTAWHGRDGGGNAAPRRSSQQDG